jgi:hypothetical protein
MSTLNDHEKELITAEIFSKTGIPLSKEDPIFALVEIIKASDDSLVERIHGECDTATTALAHASDHITERSKEFKSMVDSYAEVHIEATRATIDIETKQMKTTIQEELHAFSSDLKKGLVEELKTFSQTECIQPLREVLEIIPQRSWLENVWTLAACLAIGFATGLLYFDGTIRVPLEGSSARVNTKTPTESQKH